MTVSGLNHLTLSVSNLERSITFYRDTLGLALEADWPDGAYLSAGTLWLCLTLEPEAGSARQPGYTHYAFSIEPARFAEAVDRLRAANVTEWRDNKSEGASFYFLDPDGHRLELHVGDLQSRLDHYRQNPQPGMTIHHRAVPK